MQHSLTDNCKEFLYDHIKYHYRASTPRGYLNRHYWLVELNHSEACLSDLENRLQKYRRWTKHTCARHPTIPAKDMRVMDGSIVWCGSIYMLVHHWFYWSWVYMRCGWLARIWSDEEKPWLVVWHLCQACHVISCLLDRLRKQYKIWCTPKYVYCSEAEFVPTILTSIW